MLAEVAKWRGGDGQHLVTLPLERKRSDDLTTELGDPVHLSSHLGRRARRSDRCHFHAGLAPDLERSGVHDVRGGASLGTVSSLEHNVGEPDFVAEVGRSEAGRPCADDDDVDRRRRRVRNQNTPS